MATSTFTSMKSDITENGLTVHGHSKRSKRNNFVDFVTLRVKLWTVTRICGIVNGNQT